MLREHQLLINHLNGLSEKEYKSVFKSTLVLVKSLESLGPLFHTIDLYDLIKSINHIEKARRPQVSTPEANAATGARKKRKSRRNAASA